MSHHLPVASNWFEYRDIDDTLTLITEPHVNSLLAANIWWVHGSDRDAVIDTGLGVASLHDSNTDLFSNQPLAIVTHAHLDHLGGAHEFADAAAHSSELSRITSPDAASLYGPALSTQLGLEPEADLPELLIDALPTANYDIASYAVRPVTVGTALEEGDSIDLGDSLLTVMHLPGHTAGSIALFDERRGVLFTGDVVYEGDLLDEIIGADIPQYVESMRRLRELDVAVVHPGHGRSFDRTRLTALVDNYLVFRDLG